MLDDDVKAYTVGVLSSKNIIEIDGSIVLEFASASATYDFRRYLRIGDAVLFDSIVHNGKDAEIERRLARLAYHRCHVMTGKMLPVYEKLAVDFDLVTSMFNSAIFASNSL
jgi:hypothetical protein